MYDDEHDRPAPPFLTEAQIPPFLTEAQIQVRSKRCAHERKYKDMVAAAIKEGGKFRFPATMRQSPNDKCDTRLHKYAGLEGKFNRFALLCSKWDVWVEVYFSDGYHRQKNFGVRRFARILGLEQGEC